MATAFFSRVVAVAAVADVATVADDFAFGVAVVVVVGFAAGGALV